MKNTLIKICFASLAAMLLCFQCEKDEEVNVGLYYVKNMTDRILTLKFTYDDRYDFTLSNIAPGDSALIQQYNFPAEYIPDFNRWFQHLSAYNNTMSLSVLSADKGDLKKWRFLDKDLSGKQFFNESSWQYYEHLRNGPYLNATWVFTIQPEDITQPEP